MPSNATTIIAKESREVATELSPPLTRTASDPRPIVLITCGIAGSGKTTLSKTLLETHSTFTRLSIDEIIFSKHGLYDTDYPPSLYASYQTEADSIFRTTLLQLLATGEQDIILDRSFYAKEDRDEFEALIENGGGRWVLVYLKTEKEVLWERICARRQAGVDANSALEISREILEDYVSGFEEPRGEGEIVVEWVE